MIAVQGNSTKSSKGEATSANHSPSGRCPDSSTSGFPAVRELVTKAEGASELA
jgi:hypothetical protein